LTLLKENPSKEYTIKQLAEETGIMIEDILEVFQAFKIIRYQSGEYFLFTEKEYLEELIKQSGDPGHLVEAEKIHWSPFILPKQVN